MRMRKRKNKRANTLWSEEHKTCEGKVKQTATKEKRGRLCPIQSEIWHIPLSGQAKPCHAMTTMSSQAKPTEAKQKGHAEPSRANSSKFYLYQMTFMLHPFHFLLSTCRVTSIISSIPVDFAQYSHGYWYTHFFAYTLSNINVATL